MRAAGNAFVDPAPGGGSTHISCTGEAARGQKANGLRVCEVRSARPVEVGACGASRS